MESGCTNRHNSQKQTDKASRERQGKLNPYVLTVSLLFHRLGNGESYTQHCLENVSLHVLVQP